MRGNSHVRFGGRAEETDRLKGPHRASARPNHTHASLLIAAGVPVRVVSEWLGHASPTFTIETYQHVLRLRSRLSPCFRARPGFPTGEDG
jgi:integrase